MGKQYTVGAMSITTSAPATTSIELTQVGISANANVIGNESGSLYEQSLSLTGFAPVATATSKAIASVLGLIGLNGQCVGSAQSVTTVDVFSRRLTDCQTTLGGTPHIRDRVTTGLLRLNSISASRGQDATISVILDALTDGTNAPLARTDGVALPSTVTAAQWTLGICNINGVRYQEINDVNLSLNVSITDKSPALGQIWPEAVGVLTVKPVLTLTGRDLSKITNAIIAAGVNAAAHASTKIQLVKRANAGSFVASATTEHINITMAGLIVQEEIVSASANGQATHSLRIVGSYDGTNAPCIFNVGVAYDPTVGS